MTTLSIKMGDDGRTLLHCHAGCTTEAIMAAIGLTLTDLFPGRGVALHGRRGGLANSVFPVRRSGGPHRGAVPPVTRRV